jgi:hypothetical protein
MKEFFARLNPTERRFVVGVVVLFFIVINLVWVWPHFGDWSKTQDNMKTAQDHLYEFQNGTNLIPSLRAEIDKYQREGEVVPPADQAVRFVRVIQSEAAKVGIVPESMSSQRQTGGPANAFFVEQNETMTLQSSEKQLVDFLYNLGSGTNSLVRVKVLSVQPDAPHQRLTTRVTLIASYQKAEVAPRGAAPAVRTPAAAAKPAPTPAKPVPTSAVPAPPGAASKTLTPIKK